MQKRRHTITKVEIDMIHIVYLYDNLFPTVHARPASIGDISSLRSFPYKHNPASSRRASLAANPANLTTDLFE